MPAIATPAGESLSTQEGFGRIMIELAKAGGPLAERLVTTSPDVTVSTNLGGWVNQVGLFARAPHSDVFRERKLVSAQKWLRSPEGRHIELGIAENNLFLLLAALGLAEPLFGARLLPVGTVYDPFISRGLDALNYACYQDARFLLVATPSGITLAPEGGAHQSVIAPLIGLGQPGLTMFEPGFVDELAVDHGLGLRPSCSGPTAARSICASRPGRWSSPSARSMRRMVDRRRLLAARARAGRGDRGDRHAAR